jgi:hypothetical protein
MRRSATKSIGRLVQLEESVLDEWGIERCSSRLQSCVRLALTRLSSEALLRLRGDSRLQVEAVRLNPESIWAYFPVRSGECGDRPVNLQLEPLVRVNGLKIKKRTAILLLLRTRVGRGEKDSALVGDILHHLGHVLLYLRNPKRRNDCCDARQEVRRVWLAAPALDFNSG